MKRYITTSKHPELKEGIVFEQGEINNEYYNSKNTEIDHVNMNQWEKNGFVKEINEPEWTDEQLKEIANKAFHKFINQPEIELSLDSGGYSYVECLNLILKIYK